MGKAPPTPLTKRRNPQVCQLLVWGINKQIKKRFKAACASKGMTMHKAITTMMVRFTDKAREER